MTDLMPLPVGSRRDRVGGTIWQAAGEDGIVTTGATVDDFMAALHRQRDPDALPSRTDSGL
jgi:hypothetical protein